MTFTQKLTVLFVGLAVLSGVVGVIAFWSGVFNLRRYPYDSMMMDMQTVIADKSCPDNRPMTQFTPPMPWIGYVSCLSLLDATSGNKTSPAFIENENVLDLRYASCRNQLNSANFPAVFFGLLLWVACAVSIYINRSSSKVALQVIGPMLAMLLSWAYQSWFDISAIRINASVFVDCQDFKTADDFTALASSGLFCYNTCGGESINTLQSVTRQSRNLISGFWLMILSIFFQMASNGLTWSNIK